MAGGPEGTLRACPCWGCWGAKGGDHVGGSSQMGQVRSQPVSAMLSAQSPQADRQSLEPGVTPRRWAWQLPGGSNLAVDQKNELDPRLVSTGRAPGASRSLFDQALVSGWAISRQLLSPTPTFLCVQRGLAPGQDIG